MSPTELTDDERDVLNEVRRRGALTIKPEARSFDAACRMETGGLLRVVRSVDPPRATFVLSGRGIGVVGVGPSTFDADGAPSLD